MSDAKTFTCPACNHGQCTHTEDRTGNENGFYSHNGRAVRCSILPDGRVCCSHLTLEHIAKIDAILRAREVPSDWFSLYLANDKQARKQAPLARGLFGYFPNACLHVAHVSYVANEQHNPGLPMQWAFNKSSDEPDCELRHMLDAQSPNAFDDDGLLHLAKKAWRAMADLERYVLEHYPTAQPGKSVTGFERATK